MTGHCQLHKWLRELANPGKVRQMRWHLFLSEAKKKLWRPCREARALGL